MPYVSRKNHGEYFDLVIAAKKAHDAEMADLRAKLRQAELTARAAFTRGKAQADERERQAITEAQRIRNRTAEFKRPRKIQQPQHKPFGLRAS